MRGNRGTRSKDCSSPSKVWGLGKTIEPWQAKHWKSGIGPEDENYPTKAAMVMTVTQVNVKVAPTDVEHNGVLAGDVPSFSTSFPELSTGCRAFHKFGDPYVSEEGSWQPSGQEYGMRFCVGSRGVYIAGKQRYVDYLVAAHANCRSFRYAVRVDTQSKTSETTEFYGDTVDSVQVGYYQVFPDYWGSFGYPPAPSDLQSNARMHPDRWATSERFIMWSAYSIMAESAAQIHAIARYDRETGEFLKFWEVPQFYSGGSRRYLKLPSRRAFQEDEDDQPWWIAGDATYGFVTGRWHASNKREYLMPTEWEHNLGVPTAGPGQVPLSNSAVILFYQRYYGKDLAIVADRYFEGPDLRVSWWIYDGESWIWHENISSPEYSNSEPTYITKDYEGNFLIGNAFWLQKHDSDWNYTWAIQRTPAPSVPPAHPEEDDVPFEEQDPGTSWDDPDETIPDDVISWLPSVHRFSQILVGRHELQIRGFRSYIDLASKEVDMTANDGKRYYFLKFRYPVTDSSEGVTGKIPCRVGGWSLSHDGQTKVPHVQYITLPPMFNDYYYIPEPDGTPARKTEYLDSRPIVERTYTNFDPTEYEFQTDPNGPGDFYPDNEVPWPKNIPFLKYWLATYVAKYKIMYDWFNYGPWIKRVDNPSSSDPNVYQEYGATAPLTVFTAIASWDFDMVDDTDCGCGAQLKPY